MRVIDGFSHTHTHRHAHTHTFKALNKHQVNVTSIPGAPHELSICWHECVCVCVRTNASIMTCAYVCVCVCMCVYGRDDLPVTP